MNKFLICFFLILSTIAFSKTKIIFDNQKKVWGITQTSKNEIVFTQNNGKIFALNLKDKKKRDLKVKLDDLLTSGQGGLLDILYHKNKLYFTYSIKTSKGNTLRLSSLDYTKGKASNFKVLYTANAYESTSHHFGSRVMIYKNYIFLTVGDRGRRLKAQDLRYDNGSILRLNIDGSIPNDNPYLNIKGASKALYSKGHRNSQGITNDNDLIYNGEFGPQGGDEINIIKPGLNYGWPIVTFGEEYGGGKIGKTKLKDMTDPIKYWVPSLSFSDIEIFKGKLYLASLGEQKLVSYDLKSLAKEVIHSPKLNERFRAISIINSKVYFSTDSGKIGFIQ